MIRVITALSACATLVCALVAATATAAIEPGPVDLRFDVLRNGDPIGTTSTLVRRDAQGMVAETKTHIKVKLAFVTVYRFDQAQTERWADGRFVALSAKTDDNGTVHQVSAKGEKDAVRVDTDGKVAEVDRSIIPASIWNPVLVKKSAALNSQDGTIMKLHVVDHGDERITFRGRPLKAHHYTIEAAYSQEVWFDARDQLVKMEMTGSDGSQIEYQPS